MPQLPMPLIVGADYETFLIRPDLQRPPPVCVSFAGSEREVHILKRLEDVASALPLGFRTEHFDRLPVPGGSRRMSHGTSWKIVADPRTAHVLVDDPAFRMSCTWVAHNLPYEVGVLLEDMGRWDLLAELMEGENLRCTGIRAMLIAIANDFHYYDPRLKRKGHGSYSLADLVKIHAGVDLSADKKDPSSWRLRYSELHGVRIEDYPDEAYHYSADDSVWAREVAIDQARDTFRLQTRAGSLLANPKEDPFTLANEFLQLLADQALARCQIDAPRVDPVQVDRYEDSIRDDAMRCVEASRRGGWSSHGNCRACRGTGAIWEDDTPLYEMRACELCHGTGENAADRPRPKSWSATVKKRKIARITEAYEGAPPTTEKGNVRETVEICEASGDPILLEWSAGAKAKKQLERQIPLLREGIANGGRVVSRFPVLGARTGRPTSKGPNMFNPDRKGMFRSCFVAQPGNVIGSVDWTTLELYPWAQACMDMFGYSTTADRLNAGIDLHSRMGVAALERFWGRSVTYEQFVELRASGDQDVKDARQMAKVPNFGCPGGMSNPATLKDYAWQNYRLELTVMQCAGLIELWQSELAEAKPWLKRIGQMQRAEGGNGFTVRLPSGRIRGGCRFTSGANTLFQGPASDFAKTTHWELVKAMLCEPESPLFGVKVWLFVYDEFLFEGPAATVDQWIPEAQRLMLKWASYYFKDVHSSLSTEAGVSVRWDKNAERIEDSQGRLIPTEFKSLDRVQGLPGEWLDAMPDHFLDYLADTPEPVA